MTNDQLRIVVGICTIVLTLLVAAYLFTSTPLCESIADSRTEREYVDGFGTLSGYNKEVLYEKQWVENAGECRDIEIDSWRVDD